MKKRLGIYLNSEGIAFAEAEGKNLSSSVFLSFSCLLEEGRGFSELSSTLKIEALLQKGLRELRTDLKEAYLGFSEKESIFRVLELPYMSKKELNLALPLEVEKYIPFRIEEIFWDYQERRAFREKKIKIAFLGMKKTFLEESLKAFSNVGVRIKSVESGLFSLIGFLILIGKIPKRYKDFAVFSFTGEEGEIAIFREGFPYFSRYIKIPLASEGEPDVKKIGKELEMTLKYYQGEAKASKLERLFILGESSLAKSCQEGIQDLGVSSESLPLEDVLTEGKVANLSELKAYSLAIRDYRTKSLKFDILKERRDVVPGEEIAEVLVSKEVPLNFKPLFFLLIIGVFIGGRVFFVQISKETSKRVEIKKIEEELKALPDFQKFGSLPLTELEERESYFKKVLAQLKEYSDIPKDNAVLIELLRRSIAEGMWFKELSLKRERNLKDLCLVLQGYIYLGDAQKERNSLNKFITKLKESEFLKRKKMRLALNSVRQKELEGYKVTAFTIEIR
ncbi:MAG: pilus assembly protein PilM [Candidatus Omnitrophica bacterium]|nr:pilus assembly protein PilM [Candidatus Omnitrophota bacterium]